MQQIKSDLETYLQTNVTTTAIKWANTNVYQLNGVVLAETQINNLDIFIEPHIIPISSDRELISSGEPIKKDAFFQINIFMKTNTGTGGGYALAQSLDTLFREKTINNTQTYDVNIITSYKADDVYTILPVRIRCDYWSA